MKILITGDWMLQNENDCGARLNRAVEKVINFAEEYGPELILHTGNVWSVPDPPEPSLEIGIHRLQQLEKLANVIVCAGSCDMSQPSQLEMMESEHLHVFTEMSTFHFSERLTIVGVPYFLSWKNWRKWSTSPATLMQGKQQIIKVLDMLPQVATNIDEDVAILMANVPPDIPWASQWSTSFNLTVLGGFDAPKVYCKRTSAVRPGAVVYHPGHNYDPRGVYTWEDNTLAFHDLHQERLTADYFISQLWEL